MNNKFVENKRAYELYVKTPLLKALLKIIIPGLLISLMMGVYWFIDQIMLARLVPHDNVHTCEHLFGFDENTIRTWISENGNNLVFYGPGEVIKSAITISSPISLLILCLPFFISTGTAIIFTQAIGKNNREKAQEAYKIGFYATATLGLMLTFVFGCFCEQILTSMAGSKVVVASGAHVAELQKYYDTVHQLQIKYAYDFIFILSLGPVIPCLINLFSVLIRSEGRLIVPTVVAIAANIINVLLDFILIWYAKLGMMSGGIATFSGWIINLFSLLVYVWYLNHKNKFTWINFKALFVKVKMNYKLLLPIVLLGLSGVLVDFTYSIAMMVYLPILSKTSTIIGVSGGGEYFMTISAGVLPVLNLLFSTMWGIVDGSRPINSYNYSICNFKRIRKTYLYTVLISLEFALICFNILVWSSEYVLKFFEIQDAMLADGKKYIIIDALMLIFFSFQVPTILTFQGTNNILRANIASITQDALVFYPVLFTTQQIAIKTNVIWVLISTFSISALISSILLTIYCAWYLTRRLGFIKIKTPINGELKKFIVPANLQKMSLAEKALDY